MTQAPSPLAPLARSYAVVLNPTAGRGLAGRTWPRLEAELRVRGLEYEVIQEASGPAALARVQALPPGVAVLAVGGDGTVGALLPALVGTGRPLGVIPLGTGNDFAGMLGLKPGDFRAALSRLAGSPRPVDALRVSLQGGDRAGETRLLLNGLGMGFDAQLTARLPDAPAWLPGLGRYAWAALTTLRHLTLTPVTADVDGKPLYAGPSILAAAMNGTRYGGGFHISPESDPRDGLLNVVVSGPLGRRQVLRLMALVLPGRHLGDPGVHHQAGRVAELAWAQPTWLHLDGDVVGRATGVRVEVLPGAVALLGG
ncbi:diacylglycerol kinase family protein [Deinococcus sp. NW-56]|uniref:diacylglycerol/lipid kinase family protein n=1 Tax=Deinococcus sp. NW-56 TaxID=2080419 RepID=UPI000CF5716C|nr:diacylglycerol kinase family protein [Deinococcus sp. NW-56]